MGPVFCAFFPAAGENPVLRLAFGREEFYNKERPVPGLSIRGGCTPGESRHWAAAERRACVNH